MSTHIRTRLAASLVATSLALAGGLAAAPAASAVPAPAVDIDYFADAFPGLRTDSVFTAVTFERFERLLQSAGTFAFLIGGPADPTTSATVEQIDAVAQEYGVDTVYTFDPRLDGDDVDIRTSSLPELSALYTRLVTEYLNKDTTPQFGAAATDPYLFVYDKDHKDAGAEDRIVASLGGVEATLTSEEEAAAYRDKAAAVFDAIASGGTAEVDVQSQFEFFRDAVNQRHAASYVDATKYGGPILKPSDGEDFVLQSVTYPELENILESDGEHIVLFGGTWCHNTRAVIQHINATAAEAGIKTVYVFDLRLDGLSGGDAHIRDSASDISYLYGDLVAAHFPNLRTQYVPSVGSGQRVDYYPGGDTSAVIASAKKLQVPYLVRYDKDHGGGATPIVNDWIRDNGNGTFTEYMTEWWWVQHLPGSKPNNVSEADWPARQAASWAFADEAIAKIDGFFGLAVAPDAPAAPTAAASGQDVTVSWQAPANGGSAITSYRVSLDGGAPVTVAGNSTSHVFTAVTPGDHTVTVTAVNYLGASGASPSTGVTVAQAVAPSPSPSPTEATRGSVVSVTGQLRPGGAIVVTGVGAPTGTSSVQVELHSTPQTLGSATVSPDGTFRLAATIPQAVAPGAHSVVVLVDGVEIARTAVTITAAGLPATGGSGIPVIAIGAAFALLALGVVLQIVRRRRTI